MNARPLARSTSGTVAIAGVEPSYCRRLLQNLRAGNGSRPISAIATGEDLPKQLAASMPSVILFDLGPTPDAKGLGIVSALSALAKTIVLAGTDDDAVAVQALKAGAAGFCPRDTPTDLLRRAVQLVEAGEIWVGRRVMVRLIEELAVRTAATPSIAGGEQLTPRERELVNLVAAGASNKDIARRLAISIKTVKTHLTSVFKKLGLSTRLELAVAVGRSATAQTKVG
ncbi:MAG TPA: response regulator transcription factor [Methylomirabilota bacterium]|jgi:two-component system NarL family response regulator